MGELWSQCIELPGCFAQGDTISKLNLNMQEALNLYIEEPSHPDDLASLPSDSIKKSKNVA